MNSLMKKSPNLETQNSLLKSSSESGHFRSLEELKESLKKDLTMHESELNLNVQDPLSALSNNKYAQE